MTEPKKEDLEMLSEHDHLIRQNILPRLEKVESTVVDFTKQVDQIRQSQSNLELTILKDGQETRGTLNKFVDHQLAIDRMRMESQSDILHSDERITLKKLSNKEKISLGILAALGGSGGIFAGIVALLQFVK